MTISRCMLLNRHLLYLVQTHVRLLEFKKIQGSPAKWAATLEPWSLFWLRTTTRRGANSPSSKSNSQQRPANCLDMSKHRETTSSESCGTAHCPMKPFGILLLLKDPTNPCLGSSNPAGGSWACGLLVCYRIVATVWGSWACGT